MVRPSGSVLAYLPEPPGWRAHPPGRLPVDAADPCWSLDPAPAVVGSRPLAIVEVVDYDLFVLGTSRVITLDPLGVLEERLGDEAVRRVQRALRESRTYPSLSSAGDALHIAIFGEPGPTQWLFEAIVTPHVYASPTLWDTRLLGRRKMLGTYRDREFELDTSPDLACCNMDVLHPVSRPPSDARRHWTVRICQITPLVRRGLTDREATSALEQLLDKARRRRPTIPPSLCGCRVLARATSGESGPEQARRRPQTAGPRRQGGVEARSARPRRTARARSRLQRSALPRRREWERPGRARGGGQRRVRGSGQRRRRWRGGSGSRPNPAAGPRAARAAGRAPLAARVGGGSMIGSSHP